MSELSKMSCAERTGARGGGREIVLRAIAEDGSGWLFAPSGEAIPIPPWDCPPLLCETSRRAQRERSIALGITTLAAWLEEEGKALQEDVAPLLAEPEPDLSRARRDRVLLRTEPFPATTIGERFASLADRLGGKVTAPDPLPEVASRIYRTMEHITRAMASRSAPEDAQRESSRLLEELRICAAIHDLSAMLGERGLSVRRAAARLMDERSEGAARAGR